MMRVLVVVCAVLCISQLASQIEAAKGVDISTLVSQSSFECLIQAGQGDFAVVRGYQESGRVDPNVISSVNNAWAAGVKDVDIYIFPDYPAGNPAGQMQTLVSGMGDTKYGMIWLDIEASDWSSDLSANAAFITELINECSALGKVCGMYTNLNMWSQVVGADCTIADKLPLWYAHYDNNPSFSDFSAFGGWTTPAIKQYQGTTTMCSAGVDLNWYP